MTALIPVCDRHHLFVCPERRYFLGTIASFTLLAGWFAWSMYEWSFHHGWAVARRPVIRIAREIAVEKVALLMVILLAVNLLSLGIATKDHPFRRLYILCAFLPIIGFALNECWFGGLVVE